MEKSTQSTTFCSKKSISFNWRPIVWERITYFQFIASVGVSIKILILGPCEIAKLRPVLFVVQVMSDISKQDSIHNNRIPQCTEMRFIINTSNDEQKSPTYYLYQLRPAPKPTIHESTNLYRIY